MLWIGRKNYINNTQKQHRRLQMIPLSVSQPKKRDKDKQSADDSKGTSKKLFGDGKGDFFDGGRHTQGASYPQLPYSSMIVTNSVPNIVF